MNYADTENSGGEQIFEEGSSDEGFMKGFEDSDEKRVDVGTVVNVSFEGQSFSGEVIEFLDRAGKKVVIERDDTGEEITVPVESVTIAE